MVTDIRIKAKKFKHLIDAASTISIIGHVRPDGDCVGSTLGLYNYIIDNYKNKKVDVFLEEFSSDFNFLKGAKKVKKRVVRKCYDLCISLDCADQERHGDYGNMFNNAITTICVDHHISNKGYGDICYVDADASSCAEALIDLLDADKISKNAAECLYLGIVHDTGVFKYSNTSQKTMEVAGYLISLGVNNSYIIDETFYKKSYKANKLMARAILDSEIYEEGKIISSVITKDIFNEYSATKMETDGIVEQLRLTDGVETAIFCYQLDDNNYKFSLRSKEIVNVSVIAEAFNGGGHIRAAGFSAQGDYKENLDKIINMIKEQLS